ADAVVYQDLDALIKAVKMGNGEIQSFDCSCFDGKYITGDVTPEYLAKIENARSCGSKNGGESQQLDLNLTTGRDANG
ncbi:MAG: amidophosphoribosyltransferase, partial [Sulfuricellaceae bacterium]